MRYVYMAELAAGPHTGCDLEGMVADLYVFG